MRAAGLVTNTTHEDARQRSYPNLRAREWGSPSLAYGGDAPPVETRLACFGSVPESPGGLSGALSMRLAPCAVTELITTLQMAVAKQQGRDEGESGLFEAPGARRRGQA